MRKLSLLPIFILLLQTSCKKSGSTTTVPIDTAGYITFTILQGQHYAVGYDSTHFEIITASHQHFKAIFDSSAIYTSVDSQNQIDVNKLYGFSDNEASHHAFSARVGWAWSNDSLRLFGYTYNDSIRSIQQLSVVQIGKVIDCNIGIDTVHKLYVFTVDGKNTTMPRTAKTPAIIGYKLYPYFGGDEVAPHKVTIKVAEMP